MLISAIALSDSNELLAQEKNKFERLNQRKNKSNRRNTRRGDKGKSNKGKLRATRFKSRTKQGEKSYKGDITGRKVVTKTTRRRSTASYAQPNPYAGRKRKTEASVAKKVLSSPKYTARRSESAKRVSVNPRLSKRPREKAWKGGANGRALTSRSKRVTFTKNRSYRGSSARSASRPSERRIKSGRIAPRSSSGAYNVRRKRSPYSSFRPKKSWEKAFKGDITGRTFRTKRTVEKPIIQKPPKARYSSKGSKGDNAFRGSMGGYKSVTKPSERAWKKDISGNKLRIRTSKGPRFSGGQFEPYPKSKNRKGDKAYKGNLKGGGYKSVSNRKERAGQSLANRRPPGAGTRKGISFQGNMKASKPLKGGGSVSRKNWNNSGQSVTRANNSEQSRRVRGFQGTLKATKPLKGGGSVARNNWNNKGNSVSKPQQSAEGRKATNFSGNYKPLTKGKYDALAGTYQGDQKRKFSYRKNPSANEKSIKGRLSKNPNSGTEFTGDYKPLVRGKYDALAGTYKGDQKRKFRYKKNPNAADEALKVRPNSKNDRLAGNFKGRTKVNWSFKQNPSAADESLKNRPPSKEALKGSEFGGRTRITWNYKKNPSSAKDALKGIAPSKATTSGTSFRGDVKLAYRYKKKPNAADGALKGRPPSKAAISASNYQGNIKMSKRSLEDRHPSLKYARGRSSATQEKEKLFSFKLLFSKLFKKNEAQPDNLKEKERKPRFDKSERDIWYQ